MSRSAFVPDGNVTSFRLMSSILDLASAAGHCAQAVRDDAATFEDVARFEWHWTAGDVSGFMARHRALEEALRFVEDVKRLPGALRDRPSAPHGVEMMDLDGWRSSHALSLAKARGIRDRLGELTETSRGEAADHLARLSRKLADAERLRAA